MTHGKSHISLIVAALLCLPMMVAAATTSTTPTPAINPIQPALADLPASVIQIMAQLNAPAYAVRQSMTRQLLTDKKLTPDMLAWLIHRAQTYEQLNRLLKVAKHNVLRTAAENAFKQIGSGSLGVMHQSVDSSSFPWLKKRHAIIVMDTDPGFPAYAYLEPGDVIIGFDGHTFDSHTTAATFKSLIQAHACTDMVSMRLRRGDKTLTVHFRLGSALALHGMYSLNDNMLTLGEPFRSHWLKIRQILLSHATLHPTPLHK